MSVQEIVQPELDYRQVTTSVPTYRYRQYVPENGSQIDLDLNNRQLFVFRFGAGFVCNLSKSRLQFCTQMRVAQNYIMALFPEQQIAAIRLETDNGVVLLDQQNWHAINKVVRMANLRKDDVKHAPMYNTRQHAKIYGHSTYDSAALSFAGCYVNRGFWERGICGRPFDSALARWDLNEGYKAVTGSVPAVTASDALAVTGGGGGTIAANALAGHVTIAAATTDTRFDLNTTTLKMMQCLVNGTGNDITLMAGIETDQAKCNYREVDSYTPMIFIGTTKSADGTGTAKNVTMAFDLVLGDIFPHTILKQAQDMWFGGHSIVMSIWFMAAKDWGYSMKYDAASAVTEATGIAVATNFGTVAKIASVDVSTPGTPAALNFYAAGRTGDQGPISGRPAILVACQDSPSIVAAVQQQILGPGLTLPVQHVEYVKYATSCPTTATRAAPFPYYQTFKLSLTQGSTLLRAYHCFARNDDNLNVDEVGQRPDEQSCGLVSFRTYVNAQPLSDGLQNLSEIYKTRRAIYEACQLDGYNSNWMYYGCPVINDFTGFVDMIDKTPSSGLALSAPTDYQIETRLAQVKTGDMQYSLSVFVFLRFMRLSSAGVSISSA